MIDIKSMTIEELTDWVVQNGEPKFRAAQLFSWLHEKHARSLDEMTNLPKSLREKLAGQVTFVKEITRQQSKSDGTIKFLYAMEDGQMIETVWMPHDYGNSICISSQAGCRMGCRFCASTIGGLVRNLTAAEMLEQVYASLSATSERLSNLVVMGTGEPLDNYDNLIRFIHLISHEKGYNLSTRSITVSTCGLVPEIKRLSNENLPITLALSLHATTDEERKALMPIANKYSIDEVLKACDYYFEKTGRRVSYEYSLVKGVNDSPEHAKRLSKLLKGRNAHVNLIPVNPVKERDFKASDNNSVKEFKFILEKNSINGTIRRSVGSDIDAACGQLRRKMTRAMEEDTDEVLRKD
ncbi:MAG: 23S rRNA (adenine(2503)-C(2))-methyltransferase RlmN [Lachnospiraceae bacterium]|nr:23S rRNA (adenine(2503)-C(2))-methyltransferase RlmN [Lachnospiraceae bacterium]